MEENILKPFEIGELLKQIENKPVFNFLIPSYQRGYRWEKDQVEDLLNDLYEFIETRKNNDQKYCLQPVVVKKTKDNRLEVLDGQQRLTTIYILLCRLQKNNNEIELFSLEYETRPKSAEYLKNLDGTINDDNPDYYYISNAYVTIDSWLAAAKNKKANIATKLFDAIAESIEFIWYEIKNDIDAIDVFTRINIGKIPLTNAELVKAVFLSKNNLSLGFASSDTENKDFVKLLSLKQNVIALEWDQIEKSLHNPNLWGFIYGGTVIYETRIDYILDLMSHKSSTETNKYHSFKYFYDRIKQKRENKALLEEYSKNNISIIEKEWSDLKDVYDILLEWYNNKAYNHLIGYLINQNVKVIDIIEDFKNNNRKDFLRKIKKKIKDLVDCPDLSKLRYGRDNKAIERILLLHNVIGSLNVNDNNIYFPYDKLKNKLWTLEHIFAQNSDELRVEDYNNWLVDHFEFFKQKSPDEDANKLALNINNLLKTTDRKIDKDEFQECFDMVAMYVQNKVNLIENNQNIYIENESDDSDNTDVQENELNWINEDDSIANLALLDGSMNSSIKNSLFDIKRRMILKKDKEGQFIPNETKKVFLKYYTESPSHLSYWTFTDRQAYVESIKSSLISLN